MFIDIDYIKLANEDYTSPHLFSTDSPQNLSERTDNGEIQWTFIKSHKYASTYVYYSSEDVRYIVFDGSEIFLVIQSLRRGEWIKDVKWNLKDFDLLEKIINQIQKQELIDAT
jgi:hypothetical protein